MRPYAAGYFPMTKKLVLAAVFLGALILVLVWMQGGFRSKVPGGRTEIEARKPGHVKTIKVEPAATAGEVTVSGTVVSKETARVASRAQGYVIEIKADSGDRVKKGDVLVRIDNSEVVNRLAQAEAALESARADLIKAEADWKRFKGLYEKDSVAKKDLDDATARHDMARAAEARAQSAVEEARTMVAYGTVTAPFDGIVATRDVNVGDLVTPGKLLFTVYMPGAAELVASVGEQYAPHLKVGTPVSIRIPSIKLEQESQISEVVPQRDERTRTITVKAALKETPELGPGLYGTLSFKTVPSEAILVPDAAVKLVGQLETVLILEQGTLKRRHVKTGRRMNGKVEVLSGLNPGDEVVIE